MTRVGRQGNGRWRKMAVTLCLALALSACGGNAIQVERAAALPRDAEPAPFVVLRSKAQNGGRDFDKYADFIAGRLTSKGFSRVDDAGKARYALMFSYDGDGAGWVYEEDKLRLKDAKRDDNAVDRTVSVILFDLTRPKRTDEEVFSGRAQCTVETTTHDDILLPALFDAVLQDFPGSHRETYTVSLPHFD